VVQEMKMVEELQTLERKALGLVGKGQAQEEFLASLRALVFLGDPESAGALEEIYAATRGNLKGFQRVSEMGVEFLWRATPGGVRVKVGLGYVASLEREKGAYLSAKRLQSIWVSLDGKLAVSIPLLEFQERFGYLPTVRYVLQAGQVRDAQLPVRERVAHLRAHVLADSNPDDWADNLESLRALASEGHLLGMCEVLSTVAERMRYLEGARWPMVLWSPELAGAFLAIGGRGGRCLGSTGGLPILGLNSSGVAPAPEAAAG
jgi:hypothetical protein